MKMSLFFLFTLILSISTIRAQNLHNHSNAASIEDESNSTAGWTGPAEIETKDDNPKHGNYCIRIKSEDGGLHAEYTFNAVPGTQYSITIWAKKEGNSNPEFNHWEGLSGFEKKNITDKNWKEYQFLVTAEVSHPTIRVYASKNNKNGRKVYIDKISIYQQESGGGDPPGGGGGGSGDAIVYTNENANLPTIDWQTKNLQVFGSLGIGTVPTSDFKMSVNGKIRAKEILVESDWADFVFEEKYNLPSIKEVAAYIEENGHLQGVPSALEVKENGIGLAELNTILLQKIEELTLYLIEADLRIESLERNQKE